MDKTPLLHKKGCKYRSSMVPFNGCICSCFTVVRTEYLKRIEREASEGRRFIALTTKKAKAFTAWTNRYNPTSRKPR